MSLQEKFSAIATKLQKKSKLTDANIGEVLKESRAALIEGDVALPVVKDFIAKVRSKSLGTNVKKSLNPGQQFLKILQTELVQNLGSENVQLQLDKKLPAVILLVGLQGAGKTTTAGKLAFHIQQKLKKDLLLSSVDTQRPAASEQLQILAERVGVDYFRGDDKKATGLAKQALKTAKKKSKEVLIIDTAGRQVVDTDLMDEVKSIAKAVNPSEILFVMDAMTGQDAVHSARAFNDNLALSGVIFSKMDSDTRGGAILSVKSVAQIPIKFIGNGEKIEDLSAFHPSRVANSILGMGDIFSLIEKAEQSSDPKLAQEILQKMQRRERFNFNDLIAQFDQIDKMGGLDGILSKMQGMSNAAGMVDQSAMSSQHKKFRAMVGSMTPKERNLPDVINSSRKRRISAGSGCSIQDFSRLMKQYKNMSRMTKRMGGGGMQKMMNKLSGSMPNSSPLAGGGSHLMDKFSQLSEESFKNK